MITREQSVSSRVAWGLVAESAQRSFEEANKGRWLSLHVRYSSDGPKTDTEVNEGDMGEDDIETGREEVGNLSWIEQLHDAAEL